MDEDVDVFVEHRADTMVVTLANPSARNAQSPATWRRLAQARDDIRPETRFILLTGQGPSFSAGLDRRMLTPEGVPGEESLWSLVGRGDEAIEDMITAAQSAFTWWGEVPQVTIALVQGHAIGAGFQLALAADLLVAAPDALFAMRETSLGLVPDLGGTGPLVDRVGYSRALEICATGRYVDAEEAHRIGLANAVVDMEEWDQYLDQLCAPIRSALPGAVGDLKALLRGATADSAQLTREREAQKRRLRELSTLLGGA